MFDQSIIDVNNLVYTRFRLFILMVHFVNLSNIISVSDKLESFISCWP